VIIAPEFRYALGSIPFTFLLLPSAEDTSVAENVLVEGEAVSDPPIFFLVTICTLSLNCAIAAKDAPLFPRFDVHSNSPTKCKSLSVIPSPSSRTRIEGKNDENEDEDEKKSSHDTSLALASTLFVTSRSKTPATDWIPTPVVWLCVTTRPIVVVVLVFGRAGCGSLTWSFILF
jgi:hypothetical protein